MFKLCGIEDFFVLFYRRQTQILDNFAIRKIYLIYLYKALAVFVGYPGFRTDEQYLSLNFKVYKKYIFHFLSLYFILYNVQDRLYCLVYSNYIISQCSQAGKRVRYKVELSKYIVNVERISRKID